MTTSSGFTFVTIYYKHHEHGFKRFSDLQSGLAHFVRRYFSKSHNETERREIDRKSVV